MNETTTATAALPPSSSAGALPVTRRPSRLRRAGAAARKRAAAVRSRLAQFAQAQAARSRAFFTARRERRQASRAARASATGRSEMRLAGKVIYFVLGVASASIVGAIIDRVAPGNYAAKVAIPAVVGLGLAVFTKGRWRWLGYGMMGGALGQVVMHVRETSAAPSPNP